MRNEYIDAATLNAAGSIEPDWNILREALLRELKEDAIIIALTDQKVNVVTLAMPIGYSECEGFLYDQKTTLMLAQIDKQIGERADFICDSFVNRFILGNPS